MVYVLANNSWTMQGSKAIFAVCSLGVADFIDICQWRDSTIAKFIKFIEMGMLNKSVCQYFFFSPVILSTLFSININNGSLCEECLKVQLSTFAPVKFFHIPHHTLYMPYVLTPNNTYEFVNEYHLVFICNWLPKFRRGDLMYWTGLNSSMLQYIGLQPNKKMYIQSHCTSVHC